MPNEGNCQAEAITSVSSFRVRIQTLEKCEALI
jgi:hypothetical protein